MNLPRAVALALDPGLILVAQGFAPDPWQRDFLLCPAKQVLLNCSRQSGKSTTTAALALHTALFRPASLVLLLSPTQRQSHELFRKVLDAYNAVGRPVPTVQDAQTMSKLELANASRIIGLPGREGTIRGYSKAALLILDEAARIPDDLYRTVRPMLAVSGGRLVALSTPFGQRGWFFQEWERRESHWQKIRITWRECPRITPEFIARERASLGDQWVGQEFECQFGALEGLVYPDFEGCLYPSRMESLQGRGVGGIDFGWRNPFAAVWGILDKEDVLWIEQERYLRQTPLHEHAAALKQQQGISWVADPAGATEIAELRAAGLTIRKGDNDIRMGIAAVTARIRTGRLKVCRECRNLCAEAKLYRYPASSDIQRDGEKPIDDHNHALAALRYLISKLDARFIARLRRRTGDGPPAREETEDPVQPWQDSWDDGPWERLT